MKLFIAGASIMANYDITQYPLTGIGMALGLYLKHEVKIYNFGRPGRSTKSYIEQGHLAALEKEIGAGDYMLIEFAHNDEKEFDDYLYTAPFGAYKENLKKMIAVARNAGATPMAKVSGALLARLLGVISPKIRTITVVTTVETVAPPLASRVVNHTVAREVIAILTMLLPTRIVDSSLS